MNLTLNLGVTLLALVLMTVFWRSLNIRLAQPAWGSDDIARRALLLPAGIDLGWEPRKPFDLRVLLDEVPQHCESLLRSGGIRFVHNVSGASGAALGVLARPAELRQLLAHVVAIACHAMPRGGELRVRSAAEDRHALVEFSDAGTGQPEPLLAALFEHGARQPSLVNSTGSLVGHVVACQRIAAGHEGRIGAAMSSSTSAAGTTALCLRLPLQRPGGDAARAAAAAASIDGRGPFPGSHSERPR